MKSSRIQFSKILLLLLGVILWIVVLALIYNKSKCELYKQIANVWEYSITTDSQKRLTETGMKYISYTSQNKDSLGTITIETEKKKVKVNKKYIATPLNEEERRQHRLQSLLFHVNPIQVNCLDSLFHTNLYEKGLSIQTAVSYSYRDSSNNQLHQFSCPIDTLLAGSYRIHKTETGIDNSIILYGYTKLSWIDYIRNEKTIFLLWLGCGLIFFLIISFYQKRPVINIIPNIDNRRLYYEEQPSLNITEKPVEAPDYKIVYRHFDRILTCNNTTVTFTALQGELFNILMTGKNYQSNYEDMIQTIWPNGEGDKKKLEQLRKGLKDKLKQFPIHIEVVRSTGYYLEIDEPYTIAEE